MSKIAPAGNSSGTGSNYQTGVVTERDAALKEIAKAQVTYAAWLAENNKPMFADEAPKE